MRSVSTLAVMLLIDSAFLAAQDPAASEKDKKLLQGQWELVSFVDAGNKHEIRETKFIVFDGDSVKFTEGKKGDKVNDEGRFTVDAGKTPKTIDFKLTGGQGPPAIGI